MMDDSTLKQTLRDIGREAVPDDWNRWDAIRRRVQEESMFNRRPAPSRRWLKRIAALLVVMLLSTGAMYAFVQLPPPPTGDTGIDGVKAAGLVTDLNLVQTIDGVQVQLNWAYIDEGRAILNYQTFLINDDGSRRAADADEPTILRLSERDGQLPDLYPNRHGHQSYPTPVEVTFDIQQRASLPDPSDTVDLRLEIAYDYRPHIRNAIERIFNSQVRRSTFGSAKNGVRRPLPPEAIVFTFDFTLPIQRAVTLEPVQTVTVNEVPMTLKQISVAPSQTNVNFCFRLPDSESPFMYPVDVTLTTNGVTSLMGMGESKPRRNGEYCSKYSFERFARLPVTLTLTVEALERMPWNAVDEYLLIQREMNARGIEMRVDIKSDGTLGAYTWPSNTEESQAVLVDLGYRIEGPWVFTIDVPAPDAD